MKRSEFLRRSLLATVGLALLPVPEIFPQRPAIKQRTVYCFKVTKQLLLDERTFNLLISDEIKTLETKGHIAEYEIGFEEDDFVNNFYTVRIELT